MVGTRGLGHESSLASSGRSRPRLLLAVATALSPAFSSSRIHTMTLREECPQHSSRIVVGTRGLEPPWIAPHAPEACASTNFATCPSDYYMSKRRKRQKGCRDTTDSLHNSNYLMTRPLGKRIRPPTRSPIRPTPSGSLRWRSR